MSFSASCNICLESLNLKDDIVHSTSCGHVFHHLCLMQSLNTNSSCPQCRRPGIQHFQLFFTAEQVDGDENSAEAAVSSSRDSKSLSHQMHKISQKLDRLSMKFDSPRATSSRSTNCDREVEMYRDLVHKLQRENQDLQEILQMEKILSTSTEKELDEMRVEVRERNDMINALQQQNENLQQEVLLYETRPAIPIDNLLDL